MAGSEKIKACRLCLVMDCELLTIDVQLENSMKNILGQNISYESGLPKYACDECATFLGRFKQFRDKCLLAQTVLYDILKNSSQITDAEIRKLNRKKLKLDEPLTPSPPLQVEPRTSLVEIPCVTVKLEPAEPEMDVEDQFEEEDEVLLNTSNPLEFKTEQTNKNAKRKIKQEMKMAPDETDISEGLTVSIPPMKRETGAKRPRKNMNEASTPESTSEAECGPYSDDDGQYGSEKDYSRDSDDLSSSDEDSDDSTHSTNVKDVQHVIDVVPGTSTVSVAYSKFGDAPKPTNSCENENSHRYASAAETTPHGDHMMNSNIDCSRSENQQFNIANVGVGMQNANMYNQFNKSLADGNNTTQMSSNVAGETVTKNVQSDNMAKDFLNNMPGPSSDVIEWSASCEPIPNFGFDVSSRGLRVEISEETTPLDIFKLVFSEQLLDLVLYSTNVYGVNLANSNKPHARYSRNRHFQPVSKDEMLAFFGLCLLQSQVRGPKGRAMFSFSDPLYYHPFYTYVMSGRRFEQILRCISFSDPNSKGEKKVNDLNAAMCEHFREIYSPDRELSIDEPLILFRGTLASRQYIKANKARYGIQFYELTSADGYVLNIKMCPGKDDSQEVESNKMENTEDIVLTLLQPYLMKGHHVFMDKFYNDVDFSQKLLSLRTHTNGALRKIRKTNPRELMMKKLKKGDYFWSRKKQVYVTAWKEKRPVYFVTTRNLPKFKKITDRHGKVSIKPEEVADYSTFTGRIDRNEQMVTYYSSPLRNLPWYKNVFFHLLDIVVWNAYCLYKKYLKKRVRYEFLDFRDLLIKEMTNVGKDIKGRDTVRSGSIFSNRRGAESSDQGVGGEGNHWPEEIPTSENSRRNAKYMNCCLCIKKKKRKATKFRCKGCPRKTQLCPQCFEEWHIHYATEV